MPSVYDNKLKQLQHDSRRLEWLLLGFGLFLLGGLIFAWQVGEEKNIRQGEYNRLSTQSGIIYNDLRRQLMSIRASHFNLQAELLSEGAGFEQSRVFVDKRLRAFVQTIVGVRSVLLLDEQAQILASSDPLQQHGSLADHELVQRVMREQQAGFLYVSQPYALTENLLTVTLGSVMTDEQGNFAGMVLTELSPVEIGTLLGAVFYAEDMQASITHAEGAVILVEPSSVYFPGMDLSSPQSMFMRHVRSGNNISLQEGVVLEGGEKRMLIQQTIMPAELNISDALVITISRDHNAVFAMFHRDRWLVSGLYLLLACVSVGAMLFWQRKSRQLFRELRKAQKKTVASNAQLVRSNLQLKQQTENMRSLAFLDELTNIANRRHFNRSLEAEWRRCQREGQPLSVIMLDADYFKQFNDLYGHQQGDQCLVAIADCLKNSLTRSHDLPARIGGEEFACLLPNTPLQGALVKAERIRAEIEALAIPHTNSSVLPVVTVSMGVASAEPQPGPGYLELLAEADDALYQAKRQGRNQVCTLQQVR